MKNAPPPSGPPNGTIGTPPKGSPYSRFIPREELSSFAAWTPSSLTGGPKPSTLGGLRRATDNPPAQASQPEPVEDLAAQLRAARQSGYQDGYRDGLVALDGFKQSFATQMTAQIGQLMRAIGEQLDALEQDMASSLATSATQLARQVVRSELSVRPALVEAVAREATEALLLSARHITMRVHPDDQPLVAQGAADVIAARGARLISDGAIARGGCLVESDIGVLDATLQARWSRCVAALGSTAAWDDGTAPDASPGPAE